MASPAYSIIYSAVVSGTSTGGSPMDVLIKGTDGLFTKATSAVRGTRLSTGVALSTYVANGVVDIQQEGEIDSTTSGLGTGTATYVRVSSTGDLERVTSPGSTDDVVGWVETDGTLHLRCGQTPGGYGSGGSGGTVPTGDGFVHITAGAQDAAATALTFTGDTTGTGTAASIALTTAKVNGITISGTPAIGNQPVATSTTASAWAALNLAGGSGYVSGVLPTANQASQTMAGDVTGTTAASVVAKVNGATYPAAGALTTGTIPRVTGASTVAYGALDLANASAVTGTLPAANQASQTMAGDVTGTTAASTVAKVKGTTITTAGGALATGAVLRTTAVGTADWGAIDLSSSNAVSNSLPVSFGGTGAPTFGLGIIHANGTTAFTSSLIVNADVSASAAIAASKVVQATGTGIPHVVSGVLSAASSLIVDADVDAAAAIAGTKVNPDFGAQGVTTTGYVAAGQFRGVDGIAMYFANPGVSAFTLVVSNFVEANAPIIGYANGNSPFSVHGRMPVHALGNNTTYTVTAAEYVYQVLQFSSTTASACTITLPDPADEEHCYFKDVDVTQCNVSQGVTFKAGAGTRTAAITGGGAAAPGVPKRIFVSPGCVDLAPG